MSKLAERIWSQYGYKAPELLTQAGVDARNLAAEVMNLEKKLVRYKTALEGLTPGGSEFIDEPERCAQVVRDIRTSQMTAMHDWAKRAHSAEAALKVVQKSKDVISQET